ncbi:hypothetical protein K492DRAFT_172070 [Lichtheimia hyalospora FSU 10163]|nr:hypothetical protein K492DRAFT_172070 [Lichtheimia hyalospora FSU 10163]
MVTRSVHKIQGMETELVQAKNAVEQPGKESRWLLLGYIIIGCSSRLSLYHSVLPNGRRNVPQCFSTQCFSTRCDHVARLNLLSHSKMQPL